MRYSLLLSDNHYQIIHCIKPPPYENSDKNVNLHIYENKRTRHSTNI
jgi:hypothetical protein